MKLSRYIFIVCAVCRHFILYLDSVQYELQHILCDYDYKLLNYKYQYDFTCKRNKKVYKMVKSLFLNISNTFFTHIIHIHIFMLHKKKISRSIVKSKGNKIPNSPEDQNVYCCLYPYTIISNIS